MGIEIFIVVVLACVIRLCFLGNRLKREEELEAACSPAQSAPHPDANNQNQVNEGMNTEEKMNENQNEGENKPDTLGLMYKTLCNLGCQPSKDEDGTLSVQYQGEEFAMSFGGRFVSIWDPQWALLKADDPELPMIKEAINAANFKFGPTVVYTKPNDDGVISIHSRRDIMLHPACNENEPFVKSVLDSFFEKKNDVRGYIQQLRTEQTELQRKRRPVGFTIE